MSVTRDTFAELVTRAAYARQCTVVSRRGRRLAAIVPAELLDRLVVDADQ